jgi:nucleoside-diphosphate-sugar epimerase
MNVLEIGGSGFVGELINPHLSIRHTLRVFDRVPPGNGSAEFMQGSVLSSDDLARAMEGMDAVVYLAMGKDCNGSNQEISSNYGVNVEGVHRALQAAADAGIRKVVYVSTLSIYGGARWNGWLDSEEVRGDAADIYGFTKRLGEEVCDYFSRTHNLSCIVLRLNGPCRDEDWLASPHASASGLTCASDLARAFDAAITCERDGYTPIFITGDRTETVCSLARAREVLGWTPSVHPAGKAVEGEAGG